MVVGFMFYTLHVMSRHPRFFDKPDTSTSVDAVELRLRELGICCRPSTHYPSEPSSPVATRPWIGSLSPQSAAIASGPLALTVSRGNFTAASVIVFNGADQATTLVVSATLITSISPQAPTGERLVFVRDGSQTSNVVSFMVT
jgi:hypothetical protein